MVLQFMFRVSAGMRTAGIPRYCVQRWNVCSGILFTESFPEAFYLIQCRFSASLALQHFLFEGESLTTGLLLLLLLLTHPGLQLSQLLFLPAVLVLQDFDLLAQQTLIDGLFKRNHSASS